MSGLSSGERVIIETRYGGGYEGGTWAAFASPNVPEEAQGGDVECRSWWEAPTVATGVGNTPDEALDMLERTVRDCDHPRPYQHPVPAGFTCRFCNLLVRPNTGTVEDLLIVIGYWSSIIPLNLWVPNALSFNGDPIDNGTAMALVGDAVLALGLTPQGFTDETGGRVFHYRPG